MNYIIYYDDKMQYYRIMQTPYRYRINEIPILMTVSSKLAYKIANELNENDIKKEP